MAGRWTLVLVVALACAMATLQGCGGAVGGADCQLDAITANTSELERFVVTRYKKGKGFVFSQVGRRRHGIAFAKATATLEIGLSGDAAKDTKCCAVVKRQAPVFVTAIKEKSKLVMIWTNWGDHWGNHWGNNTWKYPRDLADDLTTACGAFVQKALSLSGEMTIATDGTSVGPGTCALTANQRKMFTGLCPHGLACSGPTPTVEHAAVNGLSNWCCGKLQSLTTASDKPWQGMMSCLPATFSLTVNASMPAGNRIHGSSVSSDFAAVAKAVHNQTMKFLSMMDVPEPSQPKWTI